MNNKINIKIGGRAKNKPMYPGFFFSTSSAMSVPLSDISAPVFPPESKKMSENLLAMEKYTKLACKIPHSI
jgi:hypothetical protein